MYIIKALCTAEPCTYSMPSPPFWGGEGMGNHKERVSEKITPKKAKYSRMMLLF